MLLSNLKSDFRTPIRSTADAQAFAVVVAVAVFIVAIVINASMNDIFDAWSREFVLEAEAGGHPASKIPSVHGFIGRSPKEKLFDEIPAARRSLFAAYEKLALFAASEPSADSKTPPPGRSFL